MSGQVSLHPSLSQLRRASRWLITPHRLDCLQPGCQGDQLEVVNCVLLWASARKSGPEACSLPN